MKIILDKIDFYYINLLHRKDRNEHIISELKKLNISANRFDALTGDDNYLSIETPRITNKGNRGCLLSHFKLLKEYKGNKILGVLEDDVEFCEDFHDRMKYIENNFSYDWDIFFLSSFYHLNDDKNFKWKNIEFEFTDVKYIHRVYSSFTTHSYLINPNSVDKILDLCNKEIGNCYAIDHLYVLIEDKLNCFAFTPGMTMQYSNLSDLSGTFKSQMEFINKLGQHVYVKNLSEFDYDSYFNFKNIISNEIKKYYFFNDNFKYTIFNFDYFTNQYNIPFEREIKEISDYNEMLSILSKINKNKAIIDVGGNCGLFAIPASLYGYKIYSFEPIDINVNLINLGIKENNCNNINLIQKALSDFNGSKDIYIPYCSDNTSFNRNVAISNMKNKTYITKNVECIKFDDWLKENNDIEIGLVKIDVQGYEKNVLDGMEYFLKNYNDFFLFIEWDQKHTEECGNNLKDIYDMLKSLNLEEIKINNVNDKLFYKK